MARFTIQGRLASMRETEKFKPYTENTYDSGWQAKRYKFNILSESNRFNMNIESGTFGPDSKIYTMVLNVENKAEKATIRFADRFTDPRLPQVPTFKKFVLDLNSESYAYRNAQAATKEIVQNTVNERTLKNLGVENKTELRTKIQQIREKHKEFISEWDFIDEVKKIIDGGEYKNSVFQVQGTIDFWYDPKNRAYREKLIPNKIFLMPEGTPEQAIGSMRVCFDNKSLLDLREESGIYSLSGWTQFYDSDLKSSSFAPVNIVFGAERGTDAISKKRNSIIEKYFSGFDNGEIKEAGVEFKMLDGAQRVEITEADLTEEQRDLLECGFTTMDEIRAEAGTVYGEVKKEYRFLKFLTGFNKGAQETSFTPEDMDPNHLTNGYYAADFTDANPYRAEPIEDDDSMLFDL
jgi:hypothetical protein